MSEGQQHEREHERDRPDWVDIRQVAWLISGFTVLVSVLGGLAGGVIAYQMVRWFGMPW